MGQYTIEGPDERMLTLAEVSKYVRMSRSKIKQLIAEGQFPQPANPQPKAKHLWRAEDVACWLHLMGKLRAEKLPPGAREDDEGEEA